MGDSNIALKTHFMTENTTTEYKLPIWYHAINMLALMGFAISLLAYAGASRYWADDYPYDYGILMFGGELFCYQPDSFAYGGEYLYPAPFYTAFCTLFRFIPEPLFWVWMLAPFVVLVILAGQRAAVMTYPPFYIHMRLGQSTWLMIPLYWLADIASKNGVRWWYGLFMPLAILKPHIAILPFVFLLWYGRKKIIFLATSTIASIGFLAPAFVIQPTWLIDWLTAGRGYKIPSIANVGIIPIHLLQLGETQNALVSDAVGQMIVLVFCGLIAVMLLWGIYQRRGVLTFYDWALIFAFTNPYMHDYDLIILLPMLANRPKRLLIALTAGLAVWVYGMHYTTYWNASVIIPLALIVARFMRLDDEFDEVKPAVRW